MKPQKPLTELKLVTDDRCKLCIYGTQLKRVRQQFITKGEAMAITLFAFGLGIFLGWLI